MTNWIRKFFAALCALTLLISCAFASDIEKTDILPVEAEDFVPEETTEIQENAGEEEQSSEPGDEQPTDEESADEKLTDDKPADAARESAGTEIVVSEVKTFSDEIGQPENLPQEEESAEQEPAEDVQPQETETAEQEPAGEDQQQEEEPAEQEPAEEDQPQEAEPAEQEPAGEDQPQEAEPAEDTAAADEETNPAPESEPEEEKILSLKEGSPKSIKGKISPENPCIVKATDDYSRTVLFTLTVSVENSVSVTLNNQTISLMKADTEDEIRYTFAQKLNKDQITAFTLTADGDTGVSFTLTISRMPKEEETETSENSETVDEPLEEQLDEKAAETIEKESEEEPADEGIEELAETEEKRTDENTDKPEAEETLQKEPQGDSFEDNIKEPAETETETQSEELTESEPEEEPVEESEEKPAGEKQEELPEEPADDGAENDLAENQSDKTQEKSEVRRLEEAAVDFVISWDDTTPTFGSVAHFQARVTGCDGIDYTLQWQISDDCEKWEDIPGETKEWMNVTITEENCLKYWRVVICVARTAEEQE